MRENLGKIAITDNKVMVSDPATKGLVIDNMATGLYSCQLLLDGLSDNVQEISIIKEQRISVRNIGWKCIGHVDVDTGMAGFFFNADKPKFTPKDWTSLCMEMHSKNSNIPAYVSITKDVMKGTEKRINIAFMKAFSNGCIGYWANTGSGDGRFPVYALTDCREVYGIKIEYPIEEY